MMDRYSRPWDDFFRREGRVFLEPFQGMPQLEAYLRERGSRMVLDLGCGTGRHVVHLAKQRFIAFGMDNSADGVRMTREWADEEGLQARIVLADMRSPLPFRDAAFDAVMSTQVIHHALRAQVLATIGEVGRILRPGGVLFVTVPQRRRLQGEPDASIEIEPHTFVLLEGPDKGLPHHLFTPDELCEALGQFEPVDVTVVDGSIIKFLGLRR